MNRCTQLDTILREHVPRRGRVTLQGNELARQG